RLRSSSYPPPFAPGCRDGAVLPRSESLRCLLQPNRSVTECRTALSQCLDRLVVDIEAEMTRAEDLEALRRPPHRRCRAADDDNLLAYRIIAHADAGDSVAGLRIEVIDEVRRQNVGLAI